MGAWKTAHRVPIEPLRGPGLKRPIARFTERSSDERRLSVIDCPQAVTR
jgi:hypothetical protein